jgi:hypothetical protein
MKTINHTLAALALCTAGTLSACTQGNNNQNQNTGDLTAGFRLPNITKDQILRTNVNQMPVELVVTGTPNRVKVQLDSNVVAELKPPYKYNLDLSKVADGRHFLIVRAERDVPLSEGFARIEFELDRTPPKLLTVPTTGNSTGIFVQFDSTVKSTAKASFASLGTAEVIQGSAIDGSRPNSLYFVTNGVLNLRDRYQVRLTGLEDDLGNRQDATFEVNTGDAGWLGPRQVPLDRDILSPFTLTRPGKGEAFLVFTDFNKVNEYRVQVQSKSPGRKWRDRKVLFAAQGVTQSKPDVAINRQETRAAISFRSADTCWLVLGDRNDALADWTWQPAVQLEDLTVPSVYCPPAAVGINNEVLFLKQVFRSSGDTQLPAAGRYLTKYTPGAGLSGAIRLDDPNVVAEIAFLSQDRNNTWRYIYSLKDAPTPPFNTHGRSGIWIKALEVNGTPGTAKRLDNDPALSAESPQLEVGTDGRWLLSWLTKSADHLPFDSVAFTLFDGVSWSPPQVLIDSGIRGYGLTPRPGGTFRLIWSRWKYGTSFGSQWFSKTVATNGTLGTTEEWADDLINTGNPINVPQAAFAWDGQGVVLATVSSVAEGPGLAYAYRYGKTGFSSNEQSVDNFGSSGDASPARLLGLPNGSALALWEVNGQLWENAYSDR